MVIVAKGEKAQAERRIVPKGARVQAAASVDLSMFDMPHQPPMPDWLVPRDYQLDAVERVVKEYARGARVVMLDAPTGTGKTAIAEMVRRALRVEHGLYVCTTKSLQDQVVRDFEYARVLKGRTNYAPSDVPRGNEPWHRTASWQRSSEEITCADCDKGPPGAPMEEQTCTWCAVVGDCPYGVARREAHAAPVAILNTSYYLAECNGPGRFRERELVVADEADTLEDQLLGYVELRIGSGVARELGVEVPKKGSHMTTIRKWLADEVAESVVEAKKAATRKGGVQGRREAERLARLGEAVMRVINRPEGWVRESEDDEKALTLVPVSVDDVAERYLWRHGERWLCMSGTTVSPDMQADALGLNGVAGQYEEIPWAVVEVPMQFAKENRRVVFVPAGSMTRKGQEAGGLAKVMRALERVLERHPEGNVLIHTFSYQLAKDTIDHLRRIEGGAGGRPLVTYTSARERERALERFKGFADAGGAILVASSMDRGIDLPGDLCRVQVVMKMPMASLGSRQVSERLHQPGGDAWYLMNNIRTLMQQCGRAVRGMDDWAVTYVLDEHFSKVLKDGKRYGMFPQWWLDGLEVGKLREYV